MKVQATISIDVELAMKVKENKMSLSKFINLKLREFFENKPTEQILEELKLEKEKSKLDESGMFKY
jgi:hypothetical protein